MSDIQKELRDLRMEFNEIVNSISSQMSVINTSGLSASQRDAKYREELKHGNTIGKRFRSRTDHLLNRICGLYISGKISKEDLESWAREINTVFN